MLRYQILALVREQPGIRAITLCLQIADTAKEVIRKEVIRECIDQLIDEGRILSDGRGRYRIADEKLHPSKHYIASDFIPPLPLSRLMAGR